MKPKTQSSVWEVIVPNEYIQDYGWTDFVGLVWCKHIYIDDTWLIRVYGTPPYKTPRKKSFIAGCIGALRNDYINSVIRMKTPTLLGGFLVPQLTNYTKNWRN